MVRVISQATFDDVVKENIEDLELSPEEAIKEAIAQFEAQGVDLSNIIKDLFLSDGKAEHLVCAAVSTLNSLKETWGENKDDLLSHLNVLKTECSKDLARRIRASKEGAYPILIYYLKESAQTPGNMTVPVLETLAALMDTQPDLLDDTGVDLMKELVEKNKSNDDIMIRTLQWISICCLKHEHNRQAVFKSELSTQLLILLKEPLNSKVLTELLQVLRRLVLDDDIRVEFGKAHEHAREIALSSLTRLTQLLKDNTNDGQLSSELMSTVASVLVRHEFCQTVSDAGGCGVLFDITTTHYDKVPVVMHALKLIKALAGNDDVKRSLMKSGIAPVVVSLLSRHMSNVRVAAAGLWCAAALALREPQHGEQLVQNGAAEVVTVAMETHKDNLAVQKAACWAIRNTVSRRRDLNSKFIELGAEVCLNSARQRFGGEIEEDAKAALRDLECEVKLNEQWKGRGVQMQND